MKKFYVLLILMAFGLNTQLFAQPTVNCSSLVNISLGQDGIAIVTPDMVSQGSLHPDGIYSVSLDTLDCTQVGALLNYTLSESVTGQSCSGLIKVEDKLPPITIANFPVIVNIPSGQTSVTILPDVIDEGSYDNCAGLTLSIDKDTYFSTEIGSTFNVVLTATDASGNQNQAFTQVIVQGNANTQIFCDTECHDTPIGDCNSGHTDTDLVEWPCDIDLSAFAVTDSSLVTPENLMLLYNISVDDAFPQYDTTGTGYSIVHTYNDTYFHYNQNDTINKVIREWTVLEWITGSIASYHQVISFAGGNISNGLMCDQLVNISLDHNGKAVLSPSMFISGPLDTSAVYTLSATELDCSDVGNLVFVAVRDTVSNNACIVEVNVEDKLAPIVQAINLSVVQIPFGQNAVTLDASDIDFGSYDNCSITSYQLDKNTFYSSEIGSTFSVTFTVADASGNSNSAIIQVKVEGNTTPPNTCDIVGNTGDLGVIIEDVVAAPGSNFCLSVKTDNWVDIVTAQFSIDWDPSVIFFTGIQNENPNIPEINPSSFNLNVSNNGVLGFSYNDAGAGSSPVTSDGETLFDLCFTAIGSSGNFSDVAISSSNTNGLFIIPEFSDNNGLVAFYTDCGQVSVSGVGTGNQIFCDTKCHSTPVGDCNSGHTDTDIVELPCDIYLGMVNITDLTELEPSNLVANFNITVADSEPWIDTNNSYVVATSYNDTYLTQSAVFTKVLREWVIIEWITGSIMSYTQVITFDGTIGTGFAAFICDTLPNSAPVTDCNGGHTLADDVEWPDDLNINDHRISPDELLNISMIDSADTRPVLGVNAVNYNYSYQDILVGLTANTLDIKREWTVVPTVNTNIVFAYDQMLYVTLPANADSIVSVTTHMGRAIPGADVNGTITNAAGIATYGGVDAINVSYTDDPLNGVDLIDLVLIRDAVLGRSEFTGYQALAADVSSNHDLSIIDICNYGGLNGVSTIDIVLLWRMIAGIDPADDLIWHFSDRCADQTLVKSNIIGFKKGDVNDSSLLDQDPMINSNVVLNDQLINAGESYSVPVGLDASYDFEAFEFNFVYDEDVLSIDDIIVTIAEGQTLDYINWTAEDGKLKILGMSDESGYTIEQSLSDIEGVLFEIKATGLQNSTLSETMSLDVDANSYILTDNQEAIFLGTEHINKITSGTININESAAITVSPNPTSSILNIRTELALSSATLRLTDLSGRVLISQNYTNQVDISSLNKGVYMLQIIDHKDQYTQRIIKL